MFEQINNIETLKEKVNQEGITLVYFGQPTCSVCHSLKPQIKEKFASLSDDIQFLDVDTTIVPEVSGEYQVMGVPIILLFVDGREYLRRARFIRVNELFEDVVKINNGVKGID